jgi:hypothetical protein
LLRIWYDLLWQHLLPVWDGVYYGGHMLSVQPTLLRRVLPARLYLPERRLRRSRALDVREALQ